MHIFWITSIYLIITLFTNVARSDDFLVMNSPDAMQFDPNATEVLLGQARIVLNGLVGESASGDSTFSAFKINNIFDLPNIAFIMTIKVESKADYAALGAMATYPLQGRRPGTNLDTILAFQVSKGTVPLIFKTVDRVYDNLEREILNTNVTEAKSLVQALRNLITTKVTKRIVVELKKKSFIGIHLDSKGNSVQFEQCVDTISKIKEALKGFFFGIFIYGPDTEAQSSTNVTIITSIEGTEAKFFNLTPIYDDDYAVIFNIILWFMVAFSLSLFSAILALINMDPGKDTIIYRMTARRSKKDI